LRWKCHLFQDPTSGKVEAKMESPSTENKPEGEKTDSASKVDTPKKEADNTKEGSPSAAPKPVHLALHNHDEQIYQNMLVQLNEVL